MAKKYSYNIFTDNLDMVQDLLKVGTSIIPNASGSFDLGTVILAFDDAYIDKLYLEGDPTTPLEAATKQYVDDAITDEDYWDRSGTELSTHYTTDDIVPNASGTQSVGTQALPFASGYFDIVSTSGLIVGTTSGGTVTDILDEDDMTSSSVTSLATQQSIKAYTDSIYISSKRYALLMCGT